ncbi:hypothetical protein AB9K41_21280 [Cribrihabitans sp. XS_ASV171]
MLRDARMAALYCVLLAREYFQSFLDTLFRIFLKTMRILFWLFSVIWAGVAFLQLMAKGLSTHAGAYPLGYLGVRYTEEIVSAEMLLLLAVGLIVHFGQAPHRKRAMLVGVFGCFMLLGTQIVTYGMDSGYVYRKELAGDQYAIPWRYHPSGNNAYRPLENTGYDTIGIWVGYPGFTPLQDGKSQRLLKVWFQKTPEERQQQSRGFFDKPRRVDMAECVQPGNWVHCRFYRDGFWYDYRYNSTHILQVSR